MALRYVTRILQGTGVSRIRYVSDTDTRPIRRGYVSAEYQNFINFTKFRYAGLIRISVGDTRISVKGYGPAQLQQSISRHPVALARRTPASRRIPSPAARFLPRAVTPQALLSARRPPATSLRSPATSIRPCSPVTSSAPARAAPPLPLLASDELRPCSAATVSSLPHSRSPLLQFVVVAA
jgi:hypothetical protein